MEMNQTTLALLEAIMASGVSESEILDKLKRPEVAFQPVLEEVTNEGTMLTAGTVWMNNEGILVGEEDEWIVKLAVAPGFEYQIDSQGSLNLLRVDQSARKSADWIIGGYVATVKYSIGKASKSEVFWGVIGNEKFGDTFTVTKIAGTSSVESFGLFTEMAQDALRLAWGWHNQAEMVYDAANAVSIKTTRKRRSSNAQRVKILNEPNQVLTPTSADDLNLYYDPTVRG
jgi:hypothetical protein